MQVHSAEFHAVQPVEVLFSTFFSSENGERGRNLLRDREALTNEQGEAVVILKVRRTASGLQREFPFGARPYTLEKNVLILSSNVYGRYRACSSRFIFVLRTNLRT